jgi:hypothetical protein
MRRFDLKLDLFFHFQGEAGDKRGANSNLAIRRASREFLTFCWRAFSRSTSVKFCYFVINSVVWTFPQHNEDVLVSVFSYLYVPIHEKSRSYTLTPVR